MPDRLGLCVIKVNMLILKMSGVFLAYSIFTFIKFTILIVDIDECLISGCANNGTCVNSNGSFLCLCTQYYNGTYCEEGRQFNDEHRFAVYLVLFEII
jgi:hypothetical protein